MKDREEFYLSYLADDRPPRMKQTLPMSVGSAFDAYVKCYLHQTLYGTANSQFDFDTLFETQVESQNRDWARHAGSVCFDAYQYSGALGDLLTILEGAENVKFEFTAHGNLTAGVQGSIGPNRVTFLGKPDAYAVFESGFSIILDWKVNGYCSSASPKGGYVKIRDGWDVLDHPSSRNVNQSGRGVQPVMVNGVIINSDYPMERNAVDWARQTCIYSWLCGASIGGDFIVAIDQLACKDGRIRVAEHRCKISKEFQENLYDRATEIWNIVHSDYIFRDVTHEESKARCLMLDKRAEIYRDEDFAKCLRT